MKVLTAFAAGQLFVCQSSKLGGLQAMYSIKPFAAADVRSGHGKRTIRLLCDKLQQQREPG